MKKREKTLFRKEAPLWKYFHSLTISRTFSQSHCNTIFGLPYIIQNNGYGTFLDKNIPTHAFIFSHRAGNLRNDFRQIRKILQRNFSLSYLLLSCLKTNRHGMTSPPKLYQTNSELLYTVVTYFSLLICMGGGWDNEGNTLWVFNLLISCLVHGTYIRW